MKFDKVVNMYTEAAIRRLWDIHNIGEVVSSLVGWNYGSGEELFNFLMQCNVNNSNAEKVVDILRDATANGNYDIIPLWDKNYALGELIDDLTQWNRGTGEELADFLEQSGTPFADAHFVVDILRKL